MGLDSKGDNTGLPTTLATAIGIAMSTLSQRAGDVLQSLVLEENRSYLPDPPSAELVADLKRKKDDVEAKFNGAQFNAVLTNLYDLSQAVQELGRSYPKPPKPADK